MNRNEGKPKPAEKPESSSEADRERSENARVQEERRRSGRTNEATSDGCVTRA